MGVGFLQAAILKKKPSCLSLKAVLNYFQIIAEKGLTAHESVQYTDSRAEQSRAGKTLLICAVQNKLNPIKKDALGMV